MPLGGMLPLGIPFLFRVLNRHKLLIVSYHGVLPSTDHRDAYIDINFIPIRPLIGKCVT
jgi:hypothetical protein